MNTRLFYALIAASFVPLGSAQAQDNPQSGPPPETASRSGVERPAGPPAGVQGGTPGRPPVAQGLSVTLGVAPVLSPAFQGSRDMTLSIFPDLRINYGDAVFASIPEGLGWNAVNQDGWKAGPLAKIRFGRDEETGGSPFLITGDSEALAGLGDIGTSGEIGGFVEKRFGPRREWQLRGEVLQGFGGHDGVVADVSLTYRTRVSGAIVNFGPRASFASSDFTQTYFGIDAVQSANSGLPIYDADGGLLSWGVGASVVRPIGSRSAATLFTSLERLGGSAADSPLVEQRGRTTQFTLGIGYGVRFGL